MYQKLMKLKMKIKKIRKIKGTMRPILIEQNREDDYKLHQQEDLRPTNTLDPSDLHNTEGNL